MDFYSILSERNLTKILRRVEYSPPSFKGWPKVCEFLEDIIENKRSVYLESDYDVDGLMCALVIQDALRDLGVQRLTTYHYRKRTHNIDRVAIQECVQGHYDYFIVTDTGSNDIDLIKLLVSRGIKVIILDHHQVEFAYDDYGENVALINTMIENRENDVFRLSAGALCFCVMDLLYHKLGKCTPKGLAAYATVSLFADVMEMTNELNRAIYYLATSLDDDEMPQPLMYYRNSYNKFNARFIGFWFSPRINACFRAEQFDCLNKLFLDDSDAVVRASCIARINTIYEDSREMVGRATDIIVPHEMENFVVADLSSVNKYIDVNSNKLWNYTGLIANQLADRYSKTALVVCDRQTYFKGSVRDLYGRDFLTIFKQLCYAGGHNAAFGVKINTLDYDDFLCNLRYTDENYAMQLIKNEPIIIDWKYASPDEAMLHDMATYNEFAGLGMPIALIRRKMVGAITERKTNYNYKYDWNGVEIQSNSKIPFGRTVLMKPFFSWKLKIEVQS